MCNELMHCRCEVDIEKNPENWSQKKREGPAVILKCVMLQCLQFGVSSDLNKSASGFTIFPKQLL